MKSMVFGMLLKVLESYMPELIEMIFDYLEDLARKSDNKIDDKIVEALKSYSKAASREKYKSKTKRISFGRRKR